MPKNGQFVEIFNVALRSMIESGEMHQIQSKWATTGQWDGWIWHNEYGGVQFPLQKISGERNILKNQQLILG